MRAAKAARSGVLLLAFALTAIGGERVAAACGLSGANCFNPTPVCDFSEVVAGNCVGCSATVACPFEIGVTLTCQPDGSCTAACTADYDGGAASGSCPVDFPACVSKTCMECVPKTTPDLHCSPNAPDCNASGLCGCQNSDDCPSGAHCDVGGGALKQGACITSCASDNGCGKTIPYCVVDGGRDVDGSAAGQCVECVAGLGCTAPYSCNTTTSTCEPPMTSLDAGADAGGGDAGSTPPLTDSGIADAGTLSTHDATVGGDGGEDTEDAGGTTYPYGKVEGGGCSLVAGGTGSSPVVFGFAGVAGLLFLRRSQRRSARRRNERR